MSLPQPQFHLDRFTAKHRACWEEFVGNKARNGHFIHSREYLDYHGDRFEDHSLLLYRGGELCAVLPAHREGETLASHRGLTFGGWLVGFGFRLADWQEAFRLLVEHARREGFASLDYRPVPPWYHRAPGEEDVFWFEQPGRHCVASVIPTSILPIPASVPFNESRRQALGAARRSGLEVKLSTASLVPAMELVAETLARRHQASPVHSSEEMAWLHQRFPGNIRGYCVEQNGIPVAAAVLFVEKTCLKLQYVGHASDCPPGAMELIYAHLFEQPEYQGRWFDFGTSSTGDGINASLLAYKESYGARLGLYRRYTLSFDPAPAP